jgi:hypothetical protein
MLIKALEMLANKRATQLPRKHGNINLWLKWLRKYLSLTEEKLLYV